MYLILEAALGPVVTQPNRNEYRKQQKDVFGSKARPVHADLGISYVQDAIHQKCNKHHTRLETHENPLLKTREENRRLKRNWPIDLI
jgi:hypothetical protein